MIDMAKKRGIPDARIDTSVENSIVIELSEGSRVVIYFRDRQVHIVAEGANAGIGTRHRLHLHKESWEYYAVLEGAKILQVEDELLPVEAGDILEIPPGVRHTLHSRRAPFRGLTFRVPILGGSDKVEC